MRYLANLYSVDIMLTFDRASDLCLWQFGTICPLTSRPTPRDQLDNSGSKCVQPVHGLLGSHYPMATIHSLAPSLPVHTAV
jgi:hypothetical protein